MFSAADFLSSQLTSWPLANTNYLALKQVQRRSIICNGVTIHLQYNPHRMLSSAAKVDAASIQARRCFLCHHNLPQEQSHHPIADDFQLLVNPYPIFPQHFTIPSLAHQPQRIAHAMAQMLTMAQMLPQLILFYNGPRCGASAPDHLHFQAGNKGFLPIEADFSSAQWLNKATTHNHVTIWQWHNYLRSVITLQSADKNALANAFECFYQALANRQPHEDEPMLNLLCEFDGQRWTIHLFPRQKHRPSYFEAEGDNQILISPASVDLGGVMILPLEVDFLKMNDQLITDILAQVCVSDDDTADIMYNAIEQFRHS